MAVLFRKARSSDVEAAIPLIYSSGPDAFDYVFCESSPDEATAFLAESFCRGRSEWGYQQHWVAELDGEVVGIGGLKYASQQFKFSLVAAREIFTYFRLAGFQVILRGLRTEQVIQPPKRGVALIYQLAVSPRCQGRGVGRQLIAHLVQQAQNRGVATAGLEVAEQNPRARALYESLGFTPVAQRNSELRSKYGWVDNHCYMEKSLVR